MKAPAQKENFIFSTLVVAIMLLPLSGFSAGEHCADLFSVPQIPSLASDNQTTIITLQSIEQKTQSAEIDFRHPMSPEAVDYIRRSTGLSKLTAEQATELYNNNLRLLASRAKAKAEDLILEDVFQKLSMSQLMSQIYSGLQNLSIQLGTEIGTTPAKLRMTMKRAIHNTGVENYSMDEVVGIIELQALADLKSGSFDRTVVNKLREEIQSRLRPQIAFRLQVDREPGCCRTAICNTCPNSFRLKEEVLKQSGKSLNTHLKKQRDSAPPTELKLFELQSDLAKLLPDTNW